MEVAEGERGSVAPPLTLMFLNPHFRFYYFNFALPALRALAHKGRGRAGVFVLSESHFPLQIRVFRDLDLIYITLVWASYFLPGLVRHLSNATSSLSLSLGVENHRAAGYRLR